MKYLINLKDLTVKYIKKFSFFIILFGFLVFCSDQGVSPDQREYIIPDENISYYSDLQPMFEGKCGWQCHDGSVEGSTLFFSDKQSFMDYQITLNSPKFVDLTIHQIDPTLSPLYNIITTNYEGYERMPPIFQNREPLNINQISGIVQWIREGAAD